MISMEKFGNSSIADQGTKEIKRKSKDIESIFTCFKVKRISQKAKLTHY